jgi:hypothetical protein
MRTIDVIEESRSQTVRKLSEWCEVGGISVPPATAIFFDCEVHTDETEDFQKQTSSKHAYI